MYQLVVLTLHKTHHSAEDTQDSKEAWPIPSQPHGRERHSTLLTFTDGWAPFCSNCSSTHNWSRTGDSQCLYSSFTSCQGTSDYCLSWRLVLQGTLCGSLPQGRLTWGQAGAGVKAGVGGINKYGTVVSVVCLQSTIQQMGCTPTHTHPHAPMHPHTYKHIPAAGLVPVSTTPSE